MPIIQYKRKTHVKGNLEITKEISLFDNTNINKLDKKSESEKEECELVWRVTRFVMPFGG